MFRTPLFGILTTIIATERRVHQVAPLFLFVTELSLVYHAIFQRLPEPSNVTAWLQIASL